VLTKHVFAILCCLCSLGGLATAHEALLPRASHPWAQFQPGSWKRVRVMTETFDEMGRMTGTTVTETRISVVGVTEAEVSLQSEVAVTLGEKRFAPQAQLIKQPLAADQEGADSVVKTLGEETLAIDGEKLSTEVRQAVWNSDSLRRVRTVHLAKEGSPAILKEATLATDPTGKTKAYSTDVEVVALDMPFKLKEELLSTAHRKVTHTNPGGTVVTLEVWSDDVPGGVVAHSSKETDAQGRLLRRSTLELVDYHVIEPPSPVQKLSRTRLFRRRTAN